ncbi:MAG: PD-(D/E)XK nuclease family protein [Arenicellales bacterium]
MRGHEHCEYRPPAHHRRLITTAVTRLFQELEQGAAVITSNRHLARQVTQRYADWKVSGSARAWTTPRVLAYDDWLEEAWQLAFEHRPGAPRLLTDDQESQVWEQIIRLRGAGSDSPALLQIPGAARTARQAWRLIHDWDLDWRRLRQYKSADTEAFLAWADTLRERLNDERWLTRAELQARLIDNGDAWLGRSRQPVWWMGFDTLSMAQQRIIGVLHDRGRRQSRYRNAGVENADVSTMQCTDAEDQWRRVARWSRAKLTADPDAQLGVVCPDLQGRRDLIEDIFEDVLHPELSWRTDAPRAFHLSLGRPLSEYPIVGAALDVLRWTAARIPFEVVSRTLRSDCLGGGDTELAARTHFELTLRDRQQESFSPSHLASLAGRQEGLQRLKDLLKAARDVRAPRDADPATWAAFVSDWLDAFGWPGDRTLDSREFQTLSAWREQLGRFAGLGPIRSRWSLDDVVRQLSSMSASRTLQFHDDQAPLQIMGAVEAAGLWFDELWLADMSDAVWPPPARPDAFIPVSLQKEYGVPDASAQAVLERTRVSSEDFLAGARRIRISFAQAGEDGAPAALSPMFGRLRAGERDGTDDYGGRVDQLARGGAAVELVDDRQAPGIEGDHLGGGVSLVADQARCPFRALAHHRLHARGLREIQPGLSAMERGRLVHEAARRLWNRLTDQDTLNTLGGGEDDGELRALVAECAAGALDRQFADSPFQSRLLDIERDRLTALLLEWLVLERRRERFRVSGTEVETRVVLGGVEFRIRVDRIDELANGARLIIDYKTGQAANVKDWMDPRMEEPQLPMYALAGDRNVAALALAVLKPGGCELRGVAEGGLSSLVPVDALGFESMARLQAWWAQALGDLVTEHREGVARVDPRSPQICRNCDAASLCRIFERAQLVEE